jgi:hypothetical protein
MYTDAIIFPVQVLAVLTALDLCDHKHFKFLTCFGEQLSILAEISSRSSFEAVAVSIVGVAAQSPDHYDCSGGQSSIRFKIHPISALVSSHGSMLCGLVKK